MKRDNSVTAGHGAPTGRVTRAQAAAFRANGGVLPLLPSLAKPEKKQTLQGKSKREATDENSQSASLTAGFQHKKRAVLKDVSNICSDNAYRNCIPAAKVQSKASQQVKPGCSKAKRCSNQKNLKLAPVTSANIHDVLKNKTPEKIPEVGMFESKEAAVSVKEDERLLALQNMEFVKDGESTCNVTFFVEQSFGRAEVINHSKNGVFTGKDIVDIDADHGNPQMCSIYAEELYTNLRAAELIRRPCSNFMETVQRDITQSMRGILIDWLVEVQPLARRHHHLSHRPDAPVPPHHHLALHLVLPHSLRRPGYVLPLSISLCEYPLHRRRFIRSCSTVPRHRSAAPAPPSPSSHQPPSPAPPPAAH